MYTICCLTNTNTKVHTKSPAATLISTPPLSRVCPIHRHIITLCMIILLNLTRIKHASHKEHIYMLMCRQYSTARWNLTSKKIFLTPPPATSLRIGCEDALKRFLLSPRYTRCYYPVTKAPVRKRYPPSQKPRDLAKGMSVQCALQDRRSPLCEPCKDGITE